MAFQRWFIKHIPLFKHGHRYIHHPSGPIARNTCTCTYINRVRTSNLNRSSKVDSLHNVPPGWKGCGLHRGIIWSPTWTTPYSPLGPIFHGWTSAARALQIGSGPHRTLCTLLSPHASPDIETLEWLPEWLADTLHAREGSTLIRWRCEGVTVIMYRKGKIWFKTRVKKKFWIDPKSYSYKNSGSFYG